MIAGDFHLQQRALRGQRSTEFVRRVRDEIAPHALEPPCRLVDRVGGHVADRQGPRRVVGAALAVVEVGDTVEVYVTGPVAESCPLQGRASAILLLGDN